MLIKNIYLSLVIFLCLALSLRVQANSIKVQAFKGGGSGEIRFEVAAPIDYARSILSDDKLFMTVIPGIQKWKVISTEGNSQIGECTMSMSSVISPSTYKVKVTQLSKDEVKFKRVSGDLKDLEGSWKLRELPRGITQIAYSYRIDSGMTLVPKMVVEKELKKHLQETKRRVSHKVFQMYKSKPIP